MKKLMSLLIFLLSVQYSFAQEVQKQIEVLNQSDLIQKDQLPLSVTKTDSLPKTKTIIWLGPGPRLGIEPLYIIDDVLSNVDNFKKIKSDDIINISVLKDKENTFMCRSTNGVIIVKTKNGLTNKEKRKLKREQKKLEKA